MASPLPELPDLPVRAVLPALTTALGSPGHAVLVGPPGAGKSTLVPLALLGEAWLSGRKILLLEPRRLAARLLARRMAALLGEKPGETVGWAVRFERVAGPRTRIEVVTDGLLLRRLQADPALEGVGLVILDELHERALETDLALALLLEVRAALRPDLRLLAMSATLEAERVAALVGGAPVLRAEGRSHPVTTLWRPRPREAPLAPAIAAAVEEAVERSPGDVLVFLPGAREIRAAAEALGARCPDLLVRPLFADLPRAAQEAALAPAPPGIRKVVLATDVAETGLTVEGVTAVVDSGLCRRPRLDPRTGTSRLVTERIALASAEQRRGRAGRLGPGLCLRLWAEAEERGMAAHPRPEILDADLAPLLLELAAWGVADPRSLAWLDPPPEAHLDAARRTLVAIGALDPEGRITPHGRRLAELPLHPRLAHLLLAGIERGSGPTAIALAALLSSRDPWRDERDPDLTTKLRRLAGGEKGEPGAFAELGRIREQLTHLVGRPEGSIEPGSAGELLALAWPERIARARPGGGGRFLLANGRGAAVDPASTLARAAWLAVAELDDAGAEGRILAAAPLDEATVRRVAGARIERVEEVVFDRTTGSVVAREVERLGAIELVVRPLARPDPAAVRRALLDGLRTIGLDRLPWTEAARALRARLAWLAGAAPELALPPVDEAALRESLDAWLGPWLEGCRSLDDLAGIDLAAALRARLEPEQRGVLDRWAPATFDLPSGRRARIDYCQDPPLLAVRVQELFGMDRHPAILDGRVPLVLELLSPAGRPIQRTRDLPGFWRGSWAEVRRVMRGRYPKHAWPEDPLSAAASPRPAADRGGRSAAVR
jgi:ATP-dependent helicase HrpB